MVMHVKTFKIYIAKKKSFMVIKSCCMFVKTYFQIVVFDQILKIYQLLLFPQSFFTFSTGHHQSVALQPHLH